MRGHETALADHRRKAHRLSEDDIAQPIRLALEIADHALADRLAALLAGVTGLRLVAVGDAANAIIVPAHCGTRRANEDLQLPSRNDDERSASDPDYCGAIHPPLTARELEVLALLAEGASNKMIARGLGISVHTAKVHVASVIDKLDAIGRTDAVAPVVARFRF